MKNSSFKLVLAAVFAATAAALSAEPALLGNKSFNGQALDAESVKAVLLGKKTVIGDTRVVIIIAKAGEAQNAFLQSSVGMTTSQFQNHWRRLFMTGGGSAPKVVDTEAEARKLAAHTPGSVVLADGANPEGLAVLSK
jgi:hypothetical protein